MRLFYKEKDKNLFIYEKYFNIYKEGIVRRGLFPNDELIILEKKINEFIKTVPINKEIKQEEYVKLIGTKDKNKNRYTLEYDKKKINEIKAPAFSFGTNKITSKITFKLKGQKKVFETIYSFITIYDKITSILNKYYQDLDYSQINKEEYNQVIYYLIYFTTILSESFPKDINLFLFYCLDFDK